MVKHKLWYEKFEVHSKNNMGIRDEDPITTFVDNAE